MAIVAARLCSTCQKCVWIRKVSQQARMARMVKGPVSLYGLLIGIEGEHDRHVQGSTGKGEATDAACQIRDA